MIFKLVNKNPHEANAYIQKDGYSRKIRPFGYIVLGELSADEIAIYKKYKAVGLILETENGPASGVKEKEKLVQHPVKKAEVVPAKVEPKEEKPEPAHRAEPVVEEKHEEPVVEAKEEEKKQEVTSKKVTEKKENLDSMTVAELKEKAATAGMDTSNVHGKKELKDALKAFLGIAK